MYGWRARIGYISAGTGEVAGEELFKAAPEGVEVLHGNLFLGEDNSTEFERVSDSLEEMARRLAEKAEVDILVVAGYVLAALACGKKAGDISSMDHELIRRLEDLTKKPVIIGITAQMEAMQSFKIKHPLVIVPGSVENFPCLKEYLSGKGFEAVSIKGMDISSYGGPYRVPLHVSFHFAKEAFLNTSGADALLFLESTFPSSPNITALEQDLSVPVFVDSLCCLWSCLRRMHISESLSGWGRLFENKKH